MKNALVFLSSLLMMTNLPAQDAEDVQPGLIPVHIGHRVTYSERVPLADSQMAQVAGRLGLDLNKPNHPLLMHALRNNRFFYVFYNDVLNLPLNAYAIQRIKKTDTVEYEDGRRSATTTYLVETFKSLEGRLKRPDQHFGYFGLRDGAVKRTIIKEFDVGVGSIPGKAAKGDWPFDQKVLFRMLQGYQEEPGLHGAVEFDKVARWTFYLSFDIKGNYELRIPELEVDCRLQIPDAARVPLPAKIKSTKDIILTAGKGFNGLVVGKSRVADVEGTLGVPGKKTNHAHARNFAYEGFTCNINGKGVLNTIFTRPGFDGQTSKGIRHGTPLAELKKVHGKPSVQRGGQIGYSDKGIYFQIDPDNRVKGIVIAAPR